MFRLEESINALMIHQKVCDHLIAKGFDALKFIKPEDWAQLQVNIKTMKYYIFEYDTTDTELLHDPLSRPEISGYEDLNFDYGEKIAHKISMIRFTIEKKNKGKLSDMVFTAMRGLLFSEKLKTTLDEAGVNNLDYYPAEINDEKTKEIHSGFYVANVIGKIACMDRDKSKYSSMEAFPDKVRFFEDLHLDYNKIQGEKIFRMKEKGSIILVHEKIKNALEKMNLTGVCFSHAEGYST